MAAACPNAVASSADGYRQLTLPDGRNLEYLVEGDAEGFPLVFHHGSPGSAVAHPRASSAARARGLALVHHSRPGYGESTPRPDRTVADVASDVVAVLDHLGRDEFVTLGWSGGGPHSLACAAMLPERCLAAATAAGLAPFDAHGLEFFSGMCEEAVVEYNAAVAGREELAKLLAREAARYGSVSVDAVADALGGLVSPVDKAYVAGEFASRLHASFERAVTHGIEGWLEDDLAFTRQWGFDPGEVAVPVSVWHGAQDRMVPMLHAKWLAEHVDGARAHLDDDEGHLSLWSRLDPMLDDLLSQAGLSRSPRGDASPTTTR